VNSCEPARQSFVSEPDCFGQNLKNCTSVPVIFGGKNPDFTYLAHKMHYKGADRYSCPKSEQNSAFKQLTELAQYS
jgi:hypothetical protein